MKMVKVLALSMLISQTAQSAWTIAQPKTALLKSFDKNCAVFHALDSNNSVRIRRAKLNDLKLESGVTKISYFAPVKSEYLCDEATAGSAI